MKSILLVDDDGVDRELIRRLLGKYFEPVQIAEADSLARGEQMLEDETIELVLLDFFLPDGTGLEFLQKMRALGDMRPVIVMTGQGDEKVAASIMRAGASDYLVKGEFAAELLHKTINSVMRQYELELEKERLAQERQRLLLAIQSDLAIASDFQQAILPKIEDLSFLRVAHKYCPAAEVSGDIYDYFQNREGDANLFVGDATGHGVAGAFLTMILQIGLENLRGDISTAEALLGINSLLASRNLNGRYVTGIFLRITETGLLSAANAGHPPLFILPANGDAPIVFKKGALALGLFEISDLEYEEETIQLKHGDIVIIYTDGLVEWQNKHGEIFGLRRLMNGFDRAKNIDAKKVLDTIMHCAEQFTQGSARSDDLTMFALQYQGGP